MARTFGHHADLAGTPAAVFLAQRAMLNHLDPRLQTLCIASNASAQDGGLGMWLWRRK